MKLRKASAGSGKTYLLANTYVDMLLNSDSGHPYRHILAVTFTNKATAEMKSRILKFLRKLAAEDADPEKRKKASEILSKLLHDYSAFSVSTIDRFFQQALKAFAREIGQFADYQVELDKESLIKEAMDRILDSLTEENPQLLEWIMGSVRETLEEGGKVQFEEALYSIGSRLESEEHRRLAGEVGISPDREFTKERLSEVRKQCRRVIGDFEKKAASLGLEIKDGVFKEPGVNARKKNPALAEFFDDNYKFYLTAKILLGQVFSLGLAGEFEKEFAGLLKEKNIVCLDESNRTLHDIIDGSDAPFVYEKLGVRFEHFLLDEFQDTSHIQWENFLPLLRESRDNGRECLIVGDVKQSIYRWRDSDWSLLASGVRRDLGDGIDEETMQDNWRSCPNVISFNNGFFGYAAALLGQSDLYSDVSQRIPGGREYAQKGNVRVDFCDDQLQTVLQSVNRAREMGARWGDIGILVRGNNDGSDIANYLISNEVPVLSDDSLKVSSSSVVRTLLSLLSGIDNPNDRVNSFLAGGLGLKYPDAYHSLVDLCEMILRDLRKANEKNFDAETLYIQAFMDDVQDWTMQYGNNLREYLRHCKAGNIFVSSPDSNDSVRIMTVHKSKGLEFKYTIFPFADKVKLYRPEIHWCHLDTKGSPFGPELDGLYPVDLTTSAGKSLFAADYEKERNLQLTDNLNIFYVALTRAENCLHIIAAKPSKACRESVGSPVPKYGRFSEILFHYLGGTDTFEMGEPYDFSKEQSSENEETAVPVEYSYSSYAIGDRLQPSAEAFDFFSEEGFAGAKASARLNGILLHSILEKISGPESLRPAVDNAVREGLLDSSEQKSVFDLLSARIASHPEWFSDALSVKNELSIIGPDGNERRPDRVVSSKDGEISVIDYKFGAFDKKYYEQVKNYCELYTQLGYPCVKGYVWYVFDDKITKI